jgi:hypothetical protein
MEVPVSGLWHCQKPEGMNENDIKRGFSQAFVVQNRGNAPLKLTNIGFPQPSGELACTHGSLLYQPCGL